MSMRNQGLNESVQKFDTVYYVSAITNPLQPLCFNFTNNWLKTQNLYDL